MLDGIWESLLVTGISRHAEGANHAGSQGYASPVTELQSGRGAPKSIRRWKPSPETYPASDGVAQRLERLTVNQRVDGSNPSTIANAGLAQLVERLLCKQDVSGSSPLTGTSTTGKGILPYGAWLKCIECSYRCDEVQLFEATRR